MKLYRQKEQLKKDILKKRIVLEKELQIEIQKELAIELANKTKIKVDDEQNATEQKEHDMISDSNLIHKR